MMKMLKALLAVITLSLSLNAMALNDDEYMEFSGAVTEGKLKTVQKYVKANPAIVKESFFAWQPLQMAASHGQLDIVKFLVENGADQNYVHPVEKTSAFHLAAFAGYQDVVKYLATHGTDINKKMKGDVSIVTVVRGEGNEKMAELLLSLGVKDDGCKVDCF